MHKHLSCLVAILLIYNSLYSAEDVTDDVETVPLSNLEQGVSPIVHGCVNVISGDYIDGGTDLEIPGPKPLRFDRFYCSSLLRDTGFFGWHHSYQISVRHHKENKRWLFTYASEGGRSVRFAEDKDPRLPRFSRTLNEKGFTNCSSGLLSALTNLKNSKIVYDPKNRKCDVNTIEGSTQYFTRKDSGIYRIDKEIFPQGHSVSYEYIGQYLKKISCTNPSENKVLAEITLATGKDKEGKFLLLEGSNGQKVRYGLKTINHKLRIKSVTCDHAPSIEFEYGIKLSKKIRSNVPVRVIEYYDSDDKEEIRNLVKCIKEPVGHDNTLIEVYNFKYDRKKKKTKVMDACGHKMRYHYTDEWRLSKVDNYLNNQLYCSESYGWGLEKINLGNLKYKKFEDANGNVLKAQCFIYDEWGNVVTEKLYGNITGNSCSIQWDGDKPKNNGCDCCKTHYEYNGKHLPTKKQDSSGTITLFEYNDKNLLTSKFIQANGKIVLREFYEYDEDNVLICQMNDDGITKDRNNLQGVTERHIVRIKPTKTLYGLPEEVENRYLDLSLGEEIVLKRVVNSYSNAGKIEQQIHFGADGNYAYTLTWTYDAHGNCIRETNALGYSIERKFDENDNLIEESGPHHGYKKTYSYDFTDRLIATTVFDGEGHALTTTMNYDKMGRLISSVDHFGHETKYVYDELGREIEKILPAIATTEGKLSHPFEKKEYDCFNNVTSHTKGHKSPTKTTYNILGKPLEIIHPSGFTESFRYNIDGTLNQTKDKTGLITAYAYDFAGRVLKKEIKRANSVLKTESHTYNAFHKLSSVDNEGITTYYTYDYAGRLIKMIRADIYTEFGYDSLGRENEKREYFGHNAFRRTIKKFDALDQLMEERIEDSENRDNCIIVQYSYDLAGNVTSEIRNTLNNTSITSTEYNSLNLPISITDPLKNITRITYEFDATNEYGQRILKTTITDPPGNKTIKLNNPLGKLAKVIQKDPFDKIQSSQELFYSLIEGVIGQKQVVYSQGKPQHRDLLTLWERDDQNRPLKMTEDANSKKQRITKYSYNAYDQQKLIVKPDGNEIRFEYDALGRLKRYYSSNNSFNYLYSYDKADRVTVVEDLVNNNKTYRKYDFNGFLLQENLANGFVLKYSYDALARPTKVVLPDQTTIDYAYDALHMRKVTRENSRKELWEHCYEKYDQSGLLLRSTLPGTVGNLVCKYDRKMRIDEIKTDKIKIQSRYDVLDNLINRTVHVVDNASEDQFSYNSLNQLIKESGHESHTYVPDSLHNYLVRDGKKRVISSLQQLQKEGEKEYQYDKNGNLSAQGNVKFEYDALDRLVKVIHGNSEWNYQYDAFNRRISKTDCTTNKTEKYLYQGQNEIGTIVDNKMTQLRVLGEGLGAEIGASVLIELDESSYVPLHDIQGHVIALFNLDGSIVERYAYSAFGTETIFNVTGESNNPWRFASKRTDPETGFVYFGRRYYDPQSLRWITPDPIGYDAGPNLYAYVNNNPLTNIDLYGLLVNYSNMRISQPFPEDYTDHVAVRSSSYPNYSTSGKEVRPFPVKFTEHESGNYIIGNESRSSSTSHGYTCGINNDLKSFDETMSVLTNDIGAPVHGTYYRSGIITGIIKHIILRFFNLPLNEVLLCAQRLRYLTTVNDKHIEIVHSNGAMVFHRALQYLTPEQRSRLYVIGLGPAYMINGYEEGLAYASNHIACPIPHFDQFRMTQLSYYDKMYGNVTIHRAPFTGHGILCDSYRRGLRCEINYLKRML